MEHHYKIVSKPAPRQPYAKSGNVGMQRIEKVYQVVEIATGMDQ